MTPWQALVERFCPPDKRICNCRDAYYTLFPASSMKASVAHMVDGNVVHEYVAHWGCQHGCQANQLFARDHVAKCVAELLP